MGSKDDVANRQKIKIREQIYEKVEIFKYLGAMVNEKGKMGEEVTERIQIEKKRILKV